MENQELVEVRDRLGRSRRWVVKIGSALATNNGLGLNLTRMRNWASQIADLEGPERQIVVVASGSVAEGASRLGWKQPPHVLNKLQAAAAVGQIGLARTWAEVFDEVGCKTAQILLTHDDLADRQRYLNARTTLLTLLDLSVVPVVNENDTVVTTELSLGDNDTLAGLVSNLIEADLLVILTDQQGLMTADPRVIQNAKLIHEALVDSNELDSYAKGGGEWGRGGMVTKLRAARLASRSATSTVIVSGVEENVLVKISQGDRIGTLLYSKREKLASRKQWLGGIVLAKGRITVDRGACSALKEKGRSLLAVGIKNVVGEFERGDVVILVDDIGDDVARGIVNYSSKECVSIKGRTSHEIESVLGFSREPEVIHRDNLLIEEF